MSCSDIGERNPPAPGPNDDNKWEVAELARDVEMILPFWGTFGTGQTDA